MTGWEIIALDRAIDIGIGAVAFVGWGARKAFRDWRELQKGALPVPSIAAFKKEFREERGTMSPIEQGKVVLEVVKSNPEALKLIPPSEKPGIVDTVVLPTVYAMAAKAKFKREQEGI